MDTPTNYDDLFFEEDIPMPLSSLLPAEDPKEAAPASDPEKPAEAAGGGLLPEDADSEYILNSFLKAYAETFGKDSEKFIKDEFVRIMQYVDVFERSHQDDPSLWRALENDDSHREFLLSLTADDVASVTGDDADELRAEFKKMTDDERYKQLKENLSLDQFQRLWTLRHGIEIPDIDEIAGRPDKYVAITSALAKKLASLGTPENNNQTWSEGDIKDSFVAIKGKKTRGRPKKGKPKQTPDVETKIRVKWNEKDGLNWNVNDEGRVIINGQPTMLRASAISGDIFGAEEIKIYNGLCAFFVDEQGHLLKRCRMRLSDLCSHLKGSRKTTREYRQYVWSELTKMSLPEIFIDYTAEMQARGAKDENGNPYTRCIRKGPFVDLSRSFDYLETKENFDIIFDIVSTPVILAYSAVPEIHQYTSHPARIMDIHEVNNKGEITDAKISSTERRERIRDYLFQQVSWMKNPDGKRFSNRINYDSVFADADAASVHSTSPSSRSRDKSYIHDVLEYWKADGFISSYKFIWSDRYKGKYTIANDPEGTRACAVDIFI